MKKSVRKMLKVEERKKSRWDPQKGDNRRKMLSSLVEDKKKLVEQLFVTVSGKTLEDLIPDNLQKRSIDELKKLCLTELEKMTNEEIEVIVTGQPSFKEQETQTEITDTDVSEIGSIETKKAAVEASDSQNEPAEEVAKDLGEDPELLELEMRARAIRSLLKLKSNEEF